MNDDITIEVKSITPNGYYILTTNTEQITKNILVDAWEKIVNENLADYTTQDEVENKIRKCLFKLIKEYNNNKINEENNEKENRNGQ